MSTTAATADAGSGTTRTTSFLLQRVQPAMSGLIERARFFHTGFLRSFVSVALGGAIIVAISAALGGAAG